uniref:Uncharacterized protein n=1 Tax=Panagrolaimus sp. PS1159 TaxID=55785 RepID=A0AC35EVQ6_9BILA
MGSPSNWYTKFLSTRCVPPLFYGETGSSSDCYALTIKLAEFRELPTGENYRIKMCFFDTQYKVFFGRQFTSKLLIGNENKINIDETIFFHSPIKEERIVVVIEIIEFDHNGEEFILGWTIVPVFSINQTFTDYSSNISVPMQVKRYQLYTGSSTLLYYITSLNPADTTLNKISAVIEASLQSHENLKTALNFIPEFLFIPQHEKIPGLKRLEEGVALVRKDIPLLAYPQEADFFAGILDNISISFGVLPEQIDSMFLDLLNKENCFNLNKSPADKNVKKLEVIERRLRIGIHNGYTFVEEPLVLYLTSRDEMESKTHSLRKRSRSLSRLSNFLK